MNMETPLKKRKLCERKSFPHHFLSCFINLIPAVLSLAHLFHSFATIQRSCHSHHGASGEESIMLRIAQVLEYANAFSSHEKKLL